MPLQTLKALYSLILVKKIPMCKQAVRKVCIWYLYAVVYMGLYFGIVTGNKKG